MGPRDLSRAMDLGGWLAQLVDHGMFDSACLLGEVLLMPPGPEQGSAAVGLSPLPSTEAYVLYADALVGRGEHRRALTYYQEGLRSLKVPRGGGSGIAGASPATPAADGSLQFNECDIKLRIARAHVALKETRNALSCLEGIASRLRSAAASLLLARLYQSTGNERAAVSAYKEAVRATPVPIEAAIALAQLGVQVSEVLALQPQLAQLPWLVQLLHAHAAAGAHDPARAQSSLLALGGHFGASSHVLLQCARAASLRGRTDEAIGLYQRARELDGALLDGMDRYAACLAERERRAPPGPDAKPAGAGGAQLGRLCRELLATDKGRPEPWVAIGIYWAARGDRARALEDCERALSIDDRHVPAHQLKGSLLFGLARPEQAVYAYRKANAIRPELESFIGLVDAYLRVERPREALSAAREACQLMPNSARAHALVGRVHLSCPGAHDRAKRVRAAPHPCPGSARAGLCAQPRACPCARLPRLAARALRRGGRVPRPALSRPAPADLRVRARPSAAAMGARAARRRSTRHWRSSRSARRRWCRWSS